MIQLAISILFGPRDVDFDQWAGGVVVELLLELFACIALVAVANVF